MDMSAAAIAPRQPSIGKHDHEHPLFPLYSQHRTFCTNHLIEADSFRDWLTHYEHALLTKRWAQHERYSEFMMWMVENQGGARECPAGWFPHNFNYWLAGGRW